MKRNAKVRRVRFAMVISVEVNKGDGFQELIRMEKEGMAPPLEVERMQKDSEFYLQEIMDQSKAVGVAGGRIIKAPLEGQPSPPKTPKQPPPKKPGPSGNGGNGSNGAN